AALAVGHAAAGHEKNAAEGPGGADRAEIGDRSGSARDLDGVEDGCCDRAEIVHAAGAAQDHDAVEIPEDQPGRRAAVAVGYAAASGQVDTLEGGPGDRAEIGDGAGVAPDLRAEKPGDQPGGRPALAVDHAAAGLQVDTGEPGNPAEIGDAAGGPGDPYAGRLAGDRPRRTV